MVETHAKVPSCVRAAVGVGSSVSVNGVTVLEVGKLGAGSIFGGEAGVVSVSSVRVIMRCELLEWEVGA